MSREAQGQTDSLKQCMRLTEHLLSQSTVPSQADREPGGGRATGSTLSVKTLFKRKVSLTLNITLC